MKFRLIEFGVFEKTTLKNKWLFKIKNNIDYIKLDLINKVIIDEKGKRIGKVLDILGNVEEPYALVKPFQDEIPRGKVYIEIIERRGKRRSRK